MANSGELTAEAFVQSDERSRSQVGGPTGKRSATNLIPGSARQNYCVKRMPERPAPPRVFCWGPPEDVAAELAAIDQALWRGHTNSLSLDASGRRRSTPASCASSWPHVGPSWR